MLKYSILGIAILIAISIFYKIKQNREHKLQEAAYEILKEEALNKALQNQWAQNEDFTRNNRENKKRMIHLAVVGSKPLISYVFNPENTIKIGRNKDSNTICLKDTAVSANHCDVYLENGLVYIKDLGSANKTIIKRGNKIITVNDGESAVLLSKDFVIVGATSFKITLFDSDIITM
ncbi:FHA domain-containing protein [Anaeromicropila herbilytica]|uniref:FHA domain-containing protein n=1 Tax=Anaeromicropila herbilytica TaxID=2785025 RepID=A0A7R7EIV2_9FIRM|nr:FHA domain-containing protein [Anaeromicropila herbilytica]BCN29965.1 hypothetical protein bsdtb5_12600 [Anaeromicropila herbilytica]